MIERVVGRLGEIGVTEVVLSLGYQPDSFREAFPDGRCVGVELCYAQEPEPLDTAGAIAFAARAAGIDDTFLALNGDVLTDLDVGALWALHAERGARATIALTPVEDPSRYGVVVTDDDGRVRQFIEKPAPGTAPSNWINAGTYVLEPSVLDLVEPGRPSSIERDVFPRLASEGSLFAMGSEAYWIDAGTPEAYIAAQLDELDGRRSGAHVSGIHPGAFVAATAKVERSVVGEAASIAEGALVVDSIVMRGAVIGGCAVIRNSIVGWDARVGSNASVLDLSVIGPGESVDAALTLEGATVPPKEMWT